MDGLGAVDFAEFSAVLFPDVKLKPEDSAADKFASAASAVVKQQQDEKKKAEESMKKSAAQTRATPRSSEGGGSAEMAAPPPARAPAVVKPVPAGASDATATCK